MAEVKSTKGGASVKSCGCKHEYQDRVYGQGQRVKNHTSKGEFRCTVCKAVSK